MWIRDKYVTGASPIIFQGFEFKPYSVDDYHNIYYVYMNKNGDGLLTKDFTIFQPIVNGLKNTSVNMTLKDAKSYMSFLKKIENNPVEEIVQYKLVQTSLSKVFLKLIVKIGNKIVESRIPARLSHEIIMKGKLNEELIEEYAENIIEFDNNSRTKIHITGDKILRIQSENGYFVEIYEHVKIPKIELQMLTSEYIVYLDGLLEKHKLPVKKYTTIQEPVKLLKKLFNTPKFYGPLIEKHKTKIITPNGVIVFKTTELPQLTDPVIIDAIKHILGDESPLFKGERLKVFIYADKQVIERNAKMPDKYIYKLFGKTFWPDDIYITNGKYMITTVQEVGKNLIPRHIIISSKVAEKMKNNENVTVADMFPGVPENAQVVVSHGRLRSFTLHIMTDKKKFHTSVQVGPRKITYKPVPFIEGVAEVNVPLDVHEDVIDELHNNKIPPKERTMVEMDDVMHIQYIPSTKSLTYKYSWGEIRVNLANKKHKYRIIYKNYDRTFDSVPPLRSEDTIMAICAL